VAAIIVILNFMLVFSSLRGRPAGDFRALIVAWLMHLKEITFPSGLPEINSYR
jgi:hypothetical protein